MSGHCTFVIAVRSPPVSFWVMTSSISTASVWPFLWPWAVLPHALFHTLPVNHPNFIDITGITNEKKNCFSDHCRASNGSHTQTNINIHVHKYTVHPLPSAPPACALSHFPVWLSYPASDIREDALTTDIEVCVSVTGSQWGSQDFQDTEV